MITVALDQQYYLLVINCTITVFFIIKVSYSKNYQKMALVQQSLFKKSKLCNVQ